MVYNSNLLRESREYFEPTSSAINGELLLRLGEAAIFEPLSKRILRYHQPYKRRMILWRQVADFGKWGHRVTEMVCISEVHLALNISAEAMH